LLVLKFSIFPNPLGDHFDDWLGQYDLVLSPTLVLGYPPIPFSNAPVLVASSGEINAFVDKYTGEYPHFVISSMARDGFSGWPVLVGYNVTSDNGTAALGVVTKSLTSNEDAPEQRSLVVLTIEPIFSWLDAHGMLPKFQVIE
jgi:hypothetical protein